MDATASNAERGVHTHTTPLGREESNLTCGISVYIHILPTPALPDLTQKSLGGDNKPRPLVRMSINIQILRTAPLANLMQKFFG